MNSIQTYQENIKWLRGCESVANAAGGLAVGAALYRFDKVLKSSSNSVSVALTIFGIFHSIGTSSKGSLFKDETIEKGRAVIGASLFLSVFMEVVPRVLAEKKPLVGKMFHCALWGAAAFKIFVLYLMYQRSEKVYKSLPLLTEEELKGLNAKSFLKSREFLLRTEQKFLENSAEWEVQSQTYQAEFIRRIKDCYPNLGHKEYNGLTVTDPNL